MTPAGEKNPLQVPMSVVGSARPRWATMVRPDVLARHAAASLAGSLSESPAGSSALAGLSVSAGSSAPAESSAPAASDELLELAGVSVRADSDVAVSVKLADTREGVLVTGTIEAQWQGPCARCMEPVDGKTIIEVRELFSTAPVEGEHYLLAPESVDLAPMVREAILLELPIQAVPCPNPHMCPNLPAELTIDPDSTSADTADDPSRDDSRNSRWAELDVLRSDTAQDM